MLKIRNIFKLSGGETVIACDGPVDNMTWTGRTVKLIDQDGGVRQDIILTGLRSMLNQSRHTDQIALETTTAVELTAEEAVSGLWSIAP